MQIHCLFDELVPISELKAKFHPKNRNNHPSDQLERLGEILKYQGIRYPVKVSRLSGFITSGHGRVLAAELAGLESFPVNYQDYADDVQEYADLQADNAIASWSELDLSAIHMDLGELGPFDLNMLGLRGFVVEPADKMVSPIDLPDLPDGEKQPLQQMTFTLHNDQAEQVKAAIDAAKNQGSFTDTGNENGNGNALARICETYLTHYGNS